MPLPALTENRQLKHLIEQRIKREGRITFAEFMDLALYHPELGYYASDRSPIGVAADYLTSPEVSSVFGHALARQVLTAWRAAGAPLELDIIELGPGTGALARDLLDGLMSTPDLAARVRYGLVETSDSLRQRQQVALRGHLDRAEWFPGVESLPENLHGHVLSNEFFDALPVHRVALQNGKLREVYVALATDGSLCDRLGDPSTPRLEKYFEALKLRPAEGNVAEVGLKAADVMRLIASKLSSGTITTLDYGYDATELYASWRRSGTLLAYYQHSYTDQFYERIGRQDITYHVDFSSLSAAAVAEGFETSPPLSQMRFLTSLGVDDWLKEDGLTLEESLARRRVAQVLLDPAGLGRIRVLVASRGIDGGRLLSDGYD